MSETTEKVQTKNASHRLYKGKKTGDGSASQWSLSRKPNKRNPDWMDTLLFLEVAPQTGQDENENYTFGWKKFDKDAKTMTGESVSVKLELPDIGEFLTVLNGASKTVGFEGKGLFHKNNNGSNAIFFSLAEKDGRSFGYNLRIVSKNGTNSTTYSHFISTAEGEVLRTLLNSAVLQITSWV